MGVALVASAAALFLWDGTVETRSLSPGDVVTVGDTLTVTVPPDWQGFYQRYADVPRWLTLSPDAPAVPIRESLTVRRIAFRDQPGQAAWIYTYGGSEKPRSIDGRPVIARKGNVVLLGGPTSMIAVVDGPRTPIYVSSLAGKRPLEDIRRLWLNLRVSGAPVP